MGVAGREREAFFEMQLMRLGAITSGILALGATACGADIDGGDPIDEVSNELVSTTHGNINCGGPTAGGALISRGSRAVGAAD
jgi:hypothetical protein